MSLGNANCFTKEHIEANRKDAPAKLAEQAIHSLELVSQLTNAGLNFRFKGGNSLLLILDGIQRFSIDADIATGETRERIDECLNKIIAESGVFTRFIKRQHLTKPWLPMVSYEVYYNSVILEDETFIFLDAMLHASTYASMKKKAICGTLYSSDIEIELPTPASILGDKLLTLGPATLGIPIGKNKEAQRLKHVHDVALLSSLSPSLNDMRTALDLCMEQENQLQKTASSFKEVYQDTLNFCLKTAVNPEEPKEDENDKVLSEIVVGRIPFRDHLISRNYNWDRLQIDMAKVAVSLSAAYITEVTEEEYHSVLNGKDLGEDDFYSNKKVQALKNKNKEASRLWAAVSKWLGKNPLDA